ncbi:MAG: hypothetical protein IJQ16_01500, partial [Selenomonadaceae bacterium]|nr:hypothetical protein [Selenomonadaceae bacterium]
MFYKAEDIHATFDFLNANAIEYLLTKNIADELPAKLKIGKDIDIIVHPKDYEKFKILMQNFGYKRIIHPHGKETGWRFIYGAHENI